MAKSTYIAHGGPDEAFAERLRDALRLHGVRTFLFRDDARPGQRLHRMMRQGIQSYDHVILVCSEASLDRPGVLNEIEESLQREAREGGVEILLPISLDDFVFASWKPARADLAQAVRDRVVADFRGAERDSRKFSLAVRRLLAALGGGEPITYVRLVSTTRILDAFGRKAHWIVERTIVPRRSDITELPYREVLGSGDMRIVATSFGEIGSIVEGGARTVVARFPSPLPQDQHFIHRIEIEAVDCFLSSEEDFVFRAHNQYDELDLSMFLPASRPAQQARAVHLVGGAETPISEFSVLERGKSLRLRVERPQVGTSYRVMWCW